MAPCFAPLCKSGQSNKEQYRTFRPDFSVSGEWVKILSKIRGDKTFDPFNNYHRLCEKHFEDSTIVKKDSFIIGEEMVIIDRERWKLTPGTIPTIFPNLPTYRQGKAPKKRKIRLCVTDPVKKTKQTNEVIHLLQGIWTEMKEHFNLWNLKIDNFNKTATFLFNSSASHLSKTIVIKEDNSLQILLEKNEISTEFLKEISNHAPLSTEWVGYVLSTTEELNKCAGANHHSCVKKLKGGVKIENYWFSKQCLEFGTFKVCTPCKLMQENINRKIANASNPVTKQVKAIKKSDHTNTQQLSKLKAEIKNLKAEKKNIKIQLHSAKENTLQNVLADMNIPQPSKTAILQAVKCAKLKSSKGMRYEMDWLLECLLLKMKSPAAYKHLRDSKVLPLPHPRTLQKLIAGQKCEFGFNTVALDSIRDFMKGKERRDRQGALLFDEVKLRKSLDFNKSTLRFDGFIDYSNYTDELIQDDDKTLMADHALVIMYRPLNAQWVQPIAAFATKGAAKGNALQKIIIEAIIKLESNNVEVVCVIGDGAKTNKNFWKRLGISGKRGAVVNKVFHPVSPDRFLYFVCDVPHLFKCIRNHFRKYNRVMFNGRQINFKFYEDLLMEEEKRIGGLRKCPKLTMSHILPNSFEKMKVSLATQLFSRSVATGMQFYRELLVPAFSESQNTENFTILLNNLFDALNGKFPKDGLRMDSPQYNRIKEFLRVLEQEDYRDEAGVKILFNNFASTETLSALRVTLTSIVNICEYLTKDIGFEYLLPNKLNQDPLERFFGLIRSSGGCEDHPTISNFLQLYRILSLYTPIKRIKSGNISPEENDTVLVSFTSSLRQTAKNTKKFKMDRSEKLEETLFSKLEAEQAVQMTPNGSKADANLVYSLSGYIIHRFHNMITCDDCLMSIQASDLTQLPVEATLVKIMDLKQCLKYPSVSFYKLIHNNVEMSVINMLENESLYGDVISRIIDSIGSLPTAGIGCEQDEIT